MSTEYGAAVCVPELIREVLQKNERGQVKNNRHNAMIVLQNDEKLAGAFRLNSLTGQTDIVKPLWWQRPLPAMNDMDLNYIMLYLEENYGFTQDKIVQKAIDHEADLHKYHPIQDYLNALVWDGVPRIAHVLHHFLGAPDDELTAECMRMFLLGAISRVFRPGCKFEYMLCIVGGQGIGKSTFFRFLACKDDWFSDDVRKLDDENVYRRLRGHWIIELSEMVATARSKSIEETKSFISRQKETYKDLYALHAVDRPRQCVFAGTSNRRRFLPFDRTGNRRFVPVQADPARAEVHILADEAAAREYIAQVWAEAMQLYRAGGFALAFDQSVEKQLDALRADCVSEDTDAGMIQAWLDAHRDRRVCTMMLHREALGNFSRPTRAESDHICEIMNTAVTGWERGPVAKFETYGKQNSWIYKEHAKLSAPGNNATADEAKILTVEETEQIGIPF